MSASEKFTTLLPLYDYHMSPGDRIYDLGQQALSFLPVADPRLRQAALPVGADAIHSPSVERDIAALYQAAQGVRNMEKRSLVGLAGPQIGIMKQIILVDTKVNNNRQGYSELDCFIDPEIVWTSDDTQEGREGCFSAGRVWGLVRRAAAIGIRAYTPGHTHAKKEFEFRDFTARIVQHELGHLEGKRFPDAITDDTKRHFVHAEEAEQYRGNTHRWPRTFTLGQWQNYSQGYV